MSVPDDLKRYLMNCRCVVACELKGGPLDGERVVANPRHYEFHAPAWGERVYVYRRLDATSFVYALTRPVAPWPQQGEGL